MWESSFGRVSQNIMKYCLDFKYEENQLQNRTMCELQYNAEYILYMLSGACHVKQLVSMSHSLYLSGPFVPSPSFCRNSNMTI